MKVLVISPEKKDRSSRQRRLLIVRALEDLKIKLLNPLPGRPPKKLRPLMLFPKISYGKETALLDKAEVVIADLTVADYKTDFLVSQALAEGKPVLGLFGREINREKISSWNKAEFFYFDYFEKQNINSVLRRFFRFLKQLKQRRGKLIVLEGLDGAGKATQAKLLLDYLQNSGSRTKYIEFPRYYSSFHGGVIGRYLKGEFGGLKEINPYLASLTYALDRLTAREEMEDWLRNGNLVIANRYTSSSLAFQSVGIKPEDKENFWDWLLEMEYKVHKLPREDLVILLNLPPEFSLKKGKQKKNTSDDPEYLKEVAETYLSLAGKFGHWRKIDCCLRNGKLRSVKQIHEEIVKILKEKNIISLKDNKRKTKTVKMNRLIECVPNFSEGKDKNIIAQIFLPAKNVPGVTLLDVESDPDHNRCLGTLVGEPEAVLAVVYEMIKIATGLIDMEKHHGEHPRIGATDVVPFVPVANMSLEDCVLLAKKLGEKVGRELKIPVYLYEAAATKPERVKLEDVRRGEYEGLKKVIESDPERKPDFGPAKMHPTAGAMVTGARKFLIAYNVNLETKDVSIAKEIAKLVRESGGGFPAVKALGFEIAEKGYIQISMNLCDFEKTNMDTVFKKIKQEAGKRGVKVLSSEIYGLLPAAALKGINLEELQLVDFKKEQVLESRIENETGR
ncbi:MAG: Thymidylate kinase [Microgenomates group bacterium ADurb.Bin219]|nr:MAG: Thymidylate kinase [Microgenomates group bacterium ADurb.Bin219]